VPPARFVGLEQTAENNGSIDFDLHRTKVAGCDV
jgi:hypothetical protein